MRPTQMELQKWIVWLMIAIGVALMIVLRSFGNLVLSIFFGLVIVILPFWLDSLVRFKFIPFLDSLNKPESRYDEDFPLWLRVAIWAFVGITSAAIWTVLVPLIFALPLWIGSISRYLFGLERLGWRYWQWGWMIAFLIQYLINFFAGYMLNNYEHSLEDRFEYP
ncbi:hypothetical protein A2572_00455 [Candidatus Collierbacteria bacterium RIFOXYD1_FULL_40_9]|uniref:Uncharacterized protein n=1 Tax=Candidatus Collierbacteria bacterium RIFOXYD1_FULL_40_9 TaxID=1817731 RepID=A0A1F5FWJ8_9BACT|nr:MAG: hypothetical protein A2572_00455 [Candidatus Collierbacteria bacterium RIFOXYD1_FULL_40_9]